MSKRADDTLGAMAPRPLWLSMALATSTLLAGLTIRFAPMGAPPFLIKYGGSFFWAMLIYWVASTLLPGVQLTVTALLAAGVATVVEFFKLVRAPALDSFRLTLPGMLLLGRFFSVYDIVAYWLAIAVAAALDRTLRNPAIPSHRESAWD